MAFCCVSFQAESLGKCSHVDVIVPDRTAGPFPVLYLLHGLSDNEATWSRNVPIADLVAEMPLIVAIPDGGKGFYCNNPAPGGGRYEDHLVQDVVGLIDRTFPTIASREGRALAGNSMGGYGAIMLALRHPGMFCAASSHSGALYFAHGERPGGKSYSTELMAALPAGEYDVFALAERRQGARSTPALRLDCGREDELLGPNRDFHEHLGALGVEHDYAEHPGGHNWQYWRDHVGETLDFVARHVARP